MGEWRVFQVGWTACTEVGMSPMCVRNRFTGFAFIFPPLVQIFQSKEENIGLSCSRFSEKWYKIGSPRHLQSPGGPRRKRKPPFFSSSGWMSPARTGSWLPSGETSWFCTSKVWEQPEACAWRETLSTSCFLIQYSQVASCQNIRCPSRRIYIFILFPSGFEGIDEGSSWSWNLQFSQESRTHTNTARFTRAIKDSEPSSWALEKNFLKI